MAKKQKTEAKKPRKKKDAPVTRPESYTFQHKFSEEELRAKSRQLAEAVAAKTETEDKKKEEVVDVPFEDGEKEIADVPFEGAEDSLGEDEQ